MAKSLKTYAQENPGGRPGKPCWACSIKESEEINQARRDGVVIPVILDWLIKERKYDAAICSRGKLNRHFSEGRHHLKVDRG